MTKLRPFHSGLEFLNHLHINLGDMIQIQNNDTGEVTTCAINHFIVNGAGQFEPVFNKLPISFNKLFTDYKWKKITSIDWNQFAVAEISA